MKTYEITVKNHDYLVHMDALRKAAQITGTVLFIPDYHGKSIKCENSVDGGTVLFYTKEDAAYNRELLKNSKWSPFLKLPFFTFEHETRNGQVYFNCARFGGCGYDHQTFIRLSTDSEKIIVDAVNEAFRAHVKGVI